MKKNYLLALVSAFLLWLAWPPINFTAPLLLVALVPLLLAIENIIGSSRLKKGKKIFLVCGLAFFTWNTASIYWVFNSLNAVMPSWIAILIAQIPFGLAALLMTVAFRLYYALRRITNKIWAYTGLVSFWIGYEYLHQSWDLAFPWMNLGNGFAEMHQLAQWYEYTGVYGGTLWILLSNILVFETFLAFRKPSSDKTKWTLLGRSIAHVLIPTTFSLVVYYNYRERPDPANVVVVQPNIDPYTKFGSVASAQLENLVRLSESAAQPNTEYFIWPETAISEYTDEGRIRGSLNFLRAREFLAKYRNGNILSGIESYALYDSAKTSTAVYNQQVNKYADTFNAAIQIENSDKVQFYHKSKLVPGVESLPFASALAFMKPLFADFGGSTGGYGRQNKPGVLYSQSGIGVAPVICYESIWGAYVGDYVQQGAQFIAIITNDGWWGDTSGKDQHLAYAKLRAIETRRWVARSANTGISAFINQRGDVVKKTSWYVPTAIKADVNLNEDLTFYVQHGDYIAFAGCFGSGWFGLMLAAALFRKKSSLLKV